MQSRTRFLIAIAIGWAVFLDILVRTSSQIVGSLRSLPDGYRAIIVILDSTESSESLPLARFLDKEALVVVGSFAALAAIFVGILLLMSLIFLWIDIIRITKAITRLLSASDDDKTEKGIIRPDPKETKPKEHDSLVLALFGESTLGENAPLVWRFMRDLMMTWILLAILSFFVGLVQGLFS